MKIDFTKVLGSPNGVPMVEVVKNESGEEVRKELTLLTIAQNSLLNGDKLTATQKYERYKLMLKLEDKDVDLSIEDVKTIKDAIGESYNIWVVGVAWDILEGKK
jgi:hypothetical protein